MKTSLIIARYNEDISWLKNFKIFKIFIYNKGSYIPSSNFKNVIKLPNIGRESHTWLHHIVENYNNLDEYNIFLQGKINDLGCKAFKDPNDYFYGLNKYGFSVSRFGLLGPLHWKVDLHIKKDKRYNNQFKKGEITNSKYSFRQFAKMYFPEIPQFVNTSYGGCFAVSREIIQKNSLQLYKSLLDSVSRSSNPIEGHYMERLWCYLFIKNKFLINSFKDVIKTKIENIL